MINNIVDYNNKLIKLIGVQVGDFVFSQFFFRLLKNYLIYWYNVLHILS
jgi:hypothetical protein